MVLAAGHGRRLGLGPKALVRVGGISLATRAVRAVRAAGALPVLVVGPAAAEVVAAVRREEPAGPLVVVHVDDAAGDGMSASWRAGVQEALRRQRGLPVTVVLVDQPGVSGPVLIRLAGTHRPGQITRAAYGGRAGHPVVFDPGHARAAAARVYGDAGAREYLQANRAVVDLVECADLGTDDDLDTPADLARWSLSARSGVSPRVSPPAPSPARPPGSADGSAGG